MNRVVRTLTTAAVVLIAAAAYPTAASAADPPNTITLNPAPAKPTEVIALSPGRATWVDSEPATHPLKYRTLTNGATFTAGPTAVIGNARDAFAVVPESVSGRRTLWVNGLRRVTLSTGTAATTFLGAGQPVRLSGTRALYTRASDGHYLLYNIKTRRTLDVTKTYNTRQSGRTVDLWGNYLVFADKHFGIWRKNLSVSAKPVLVSPAPAPPDRLQDIYVYAYGNWIAYARSYGFTDFNTTLCGMRNVGSMAPAVRAPHCFSTVTTAGLLRQDVTYGPWFLQRWGSTASTRLNVPDHSYVSSIDGPNVAWTDSAGRGKVSPLLAGIANRPRSLGNPLTPHAIRVGAHWYLDLVTSAVLTSCHVSILTTAGHLVRSLPCIGRAARQGEVATTWDGRNASGKVVAAGTYIWRISAGNADGSLLRSDGRQLPTRGTFRFIT